MSKVKDYCRIEASAIIVSSTHALMPGQIVIRHGRIVAMTESVAETPDVRIENGVLLPGLINPHTHLEFSDLAKPLPAGKHFPEWIQNVLAERLRTSHERLTQAQSIRLGLDESWRAGVAALGDIVTPPWQPACIIDEDTRENSHELLDLSDEASALWREHAYRASGSPHVVAFIEQLGLSPSRREVFTSWRDDLLSRSTDNWPSSLQELALSPHAPYSTPPELWRDVAQLAARIHVPLAMHVLESPAERQWIDDGSGPMAEMLANFGAVGWRLPSDFLADLCQQLSLAPSALMIHGNYLSDAELETVAGHRNISLVYCPRTHTHFGHKPYPMESIIQRGIRLLIGTDSRSTNPDLNLWQDARTALALHPSLSPTAAFAAITDSAAQALQIDDDYGSLQTGRRAALNLIRCASLKRSNLDQLFQQLFDAAPHPQLLT